LNEACYYFYDSPYFETLGKNKNKIELETII